MMHQYSAAWKSTPAPAVAVADTAASISMIAYRSRAVIKPTAADLERIVQQARERNRSEGVTGLLIYDQGSFFQWLEGPALGVARVWESISRDARYWAKALGMNCSPMSCFRGWRCDTIKNSRHGPPPRH
jgi:hypothetical protein